MRPPEPRAPVSRARSTRTRTSTARSRRSACRRRRRRRANFVEILERVWWRLDRALDAAALRAGARLYAAEALLAGTTDAGRSPRVARASSRARSTCWPTRASELGIRAVLCYGATERNGGREEAAARARASAARFARANRRPLVRGVVGLHASFTVSDETVARGGRGCARELGTVMHVHLAEDRADVEDARARGYAGPLERLLALGAAARPARSSRTACTSTPAQVRAAREARRCGSCRTRARTRTTASATPRRSAASRRVALGTDGFPADMRGRARRAAAHRARARATPRRRRRWRGRLEAARTLIERAIPGDDPPATGCGTAPRARRPRAPSSASRSAAASVVEHGRLVHADLEEICARGRARPAARCGAAWRRFP